MIHVVTSDNLHLYAAQLDQMFALRPEPRVDHLDDEHAAYLIAADAFGEVDACLRLRPHPGEPGRLEASRCVRRPPSTGETPLADPVDQLLLGLFEHCEAARCVRVEIAPDPELLAGLARLGCPAADDGAGQRWIVVSPALLAAARSRAGVRAPVLAPQLLKREQPGLSAGLPR